MRSKNYFFIKFVDFVLLQIKNSKSKFYRINVHQICECPIFPTFIPYFLLDP